MCLAQLMSKEKDMEKLKQQLAEAQKLGDENKELHKVSATVDNV